MFVFIIIKIKYCHRLLNQRYLSSYENAHQNFISNTIYIKRRILDEFTCTGLTSCLNKCKYECLKVKKVLDDRSKLCDVAPFVKDCRKNKRLYGIHLKRCNSCKEILIKKGYINKDLLEKEEKNVLKEIEQEKVKLTDLNLKEKEKENQESTDSLLKQKQEIIQNIIKVMIKNSLSIEDLVSEIQKSKIQILQQHNRIIRRKRRNKK